MTTGVKERFFSENYLTFEYQKDNILCGVFEESYYFFQYDSMLKVKEISSKDISYLFEDNYIGHLSFASPNFEFLGFLSSDKFVMIHQSSEEGPWSKVYEISLPNSYSDSNIPYEINENGTEIWETGKIYYWDSLNKYLWNGTAYSLEENIILDTDPTFNSEVFSKRFFYQNNSLFHLKITVDYYRTVNCSNFEVNYGNFNFLESYDHCGYHTRCFFAERQDHNMNVIFVGDNFTSILELPIFPNSSINYSPVRTLYINGYVENLVMAPHSDYIFLLENIRAAEYLYESDLGGDGVNQYFIYCYQISNSSITWWWALDNAPRSISYLIMHRINDLLIIEIPHYSYDLGTSSTSVLIFDIPRIGTGEIELKAIFSNKYMNPWFRIINFLSLVVFLCPLHPLRLVDKKEEVIRTY